MPDLIVQKKIHIDLVRHNHFYFYGRRENGQTVAPAQNITRERAMEIHNANLDEIIIQTGLVDFDASKALEFSITYEVEA